MARRKSIYVEGFSHKNPIPAACLIGSTLYSGSIQERTRRPASTARRWRSNAC